MSAMIMMSLAAIVAVASAQAFLSDIGLGGPDAVIPVFDSQRSSVVSSASRGNPFTSFSSSSSPAASRSRQTSLKFEDFFSSSRVGTPKKSSTTHTPSRPASDHSSRRIEVSAPLPPPRKAATPKPEIMSRITPATETLSKQQTPTRASSSYSPRESSSSTRGSTSFTSRGTSPSGSVQANPDLSSRGRIQDEVIIPVTRPSTTTEANEVVDVRDNLVGQSICARGSTGDACRDHLAITAMACPTGFCQQCQQCETMSPDLWIKCCREHFLCCRPLVKACQNCHLSMLTPFCGAAFGRCN